MHINFNNCNVAVTGTAIGFGREIALLFYRLGAKVNACDIRAEEMAHLHLAGVNTAVVDLRDRHAAENWIKDISSDGDIDILINNAGGVAGHAGKSIEDVQDEEWDTILDINLSSAFALCRAIAPQMKKRKKGVIINISSGAALKASLTGIQAYCAAKHAVLGLTRQLAHELGPYGIRVNSVAPGFVITNEATQKQWDKFGEEKQKNIINNIAMRRLGTPVDIANTVAFLASEYASLINGQLISVDGGA